MSRWGSRGGGWVGGPGQKTSNLSPCPVPLLVKLNVKCRGSVETDAYLAEFGSEWTDGFKRHTARGAQTRPRTELQIHLTIFLSWQPVVSLQLQGKSMADPEWSCKRWNNVHYRARQGCIRTRGNQRNRWCLKTKKPMLGYLFPRRWLLWPFATEC